MEESTPQIDARTRAQAVKQLNKERAEARKRAEEALRGAYAQIKDETAFQDAIGKARQFAGYHTKLAKDGVGMRPNGKNPDGTDHFEEYTLKPAERISHLDNAAGLEELIAYIERKVEL